jgi:hypothetical protein
MRKSAKPAFSAKTVQAVEMAVVEAEVRGELADAAIEVQDDKTKGLIKSMVAELRRGVTGEIYVASTGQHAPIPKEAVDSNLRYMATEILKDLAVFDIRVGTYVIPPSLCVLCGVEL